MLYNTGTSLTIYQVAELSGTAFLRTSTPMNNISGFKQAGIFRFNRNIFPESVFLPAEVLNQAIIADGQHKNVAAFDHDKGVTAAENVLSVTSSNSHSCTSHSYVDSITTPLRVSRTAIYDNVPSSSSNCNQSHSSNNEFS